MGPATVAIVGCGFSGTMVAVHLARPGPDSPRVLLFERAERLARGLAYGTSSPDHLLNVPARLMSAFGDEPDHFLNWLHDRDPAVQPGAFVSRQVYGDYLEDLLRDAARRPGSKLTAIRAEIVDMVDEASGSFSLVTSQGTRFQADAVVVAVGNPGPQDPIPVVKQTEREGGDWRSVIDALRPELQPLWESLDDRERRRFLRHLAAFWDVHRHRLAPQIHEIVQRARREGRFSVVAGRIRTLLDDGPASVQVVVNRRGSSTCELLRARRVINCTGPSRCLHSGFPSLLTALCDRGLARPDPIGLGLQAGVKGCLISTEAAHGQRIFTLGPVLKGQLWESTAVRELRQQAAELARQVALAAAPKPGKNLFQPHRELLARPTRAV